MISALLLVLIVCSAVFSGLTIGMFSLSVSGLERKMRLGDVRAERILKIRRNGNFLLCTLLLGNVAVNSGISILMSDLAPGIMAGVISTALIFIFGEVLPQATCARYAVKVGYNTAWLVRIFMFIMWPIAKPLSMLLDFILGKEFPELYNKQELTELINDHEESSIDADERRILNGAMHFSEKCAADIMTPITVVYFQQESDLLNTSMLENIKKEQYSRMPVVSDNDRDQVIGILYAKDLIGINVDSHATVGSVMRPQIVSVNANMKLDLLLNTLIKEKLHMSAVFNDFGTFLGIVTMEDIVEQVLAIEIMDETDDYVNMRDKAKDKYTVLAQ